MTKHENNNSAKKKLIPAVAMLTTSAVMLSTSTYAWFTMSREVEVQNIQMTATTPEDIQISLGQLNTDANSQEGFANNKGILVGTENADNGNVNPPRAIAEDWANSVDISNYYSMGRIIPASSTNGLKVYFTPDAAGVGKTIKAGAKYYKAVEGATVAKDSEDVNADSRMTTLHAYKTAGGDTWATTEGFGNYAKATTWNDTNDDGYFVDIPVWFRSSSKSDTPLYVDAYVTTNSKNDEDDLYLAARAVILDETKATTSNLIHIKEGSYAGDNSIIDFMNSTNATGAAVSGEGTDNAGTYEAESYYNGNTAVVTVPAAASDKNYSEVKKVWVRVWLEGEDSNCWNQNAGQDFNISLKFQKDPVTLPATIHQWSAPANSTAESLTNGTQMKITVNNVELVYTYSYGATSWNLTSGTFPAPETGKQYKIGDTVINNEAELESYLNTKVKTAADVSTGVNVSVSDIT